MKITRTMPALIIASLCFASVQAQAQTWDKASPANGSSGSITQNPPASAHVCSFSVYPPYSAYVFDSTGGNSSSFNKWYLVFDGQTIGSWMSGHMNVYDARGRVHIPTFSQGVKYKIGQFNYYLPTDAEQSRYYTKYGVKVFYKVCREPAS